MANHLINSAQIKELFYSEQRTKHASIEMFKTYKKRYESMGFVSSHSFSIPKDWFFDQIKEDQGLSEKEIEELKHKHANLIIWKEGFDE